MYEHRVLKLQTHFSQNVPFIGCNIFSQHMVICWSLYLHFIQVSQGFNVYYLTFGYKIVRSLVFHIWNHLYETPKALSSKTLKSPKVVLHSEPNIGFNLS